MKHISVMTRKSRDARTPATDGALASRPVRQRKCAACEEEQYQPLQQSKVVGRSVERRGTGLIQAGGLPGAPEAPVRLPGHGHGAELPEAVRARMEDVFGVDFSRVRVHEGRHAPSVGALAYTQGTDIYFAPGQYQPSSPRGQELLGHELTHVVQQSQGRVRAISQARGVDINDDISLEREADEMGARAMRMTASPGHAREPAPVTAQAKRWLMPELAHAVKHGIASTHTLQRQTASSTTQPDWHPEFPGCSAVQGAQLDNLLVLAQSLVIGSIADLEHELEPSPSGIITRARSALINNFHTEDPKDIKTIISRLKGISGQLAKGPKNLRCMTDPRCDALCAGAGAPFACAGPGIPITVCSGVFDRTRAEHRLFYVVVLIHEAAHQVGAALHSYDASARKAVPNERQRALGSANSYADFAEDRSIGGTGSYNFFRR